MAWKSTLFAQNPRPSPILPPKRHPNNLRQFQLFLIFHSTSDLNNFLALIVISDQRDEWMSILAQNRLRKLRPSAEVTTKWARQTERSEQSGTISIFEEKVERSDVYFCKKCVERSDWQFSKISLKFLAFCFFEKIFLIWDFSNSV